eukprot:TRINITY_DN15118_c0_g1_i1.p1 TRINITY_DN15118_c0_g1~~TRINITY_DN15118_c0_g1_i1.p1  ORF type:complete len:122 (-),score=14.89 TRINITY_DN15118_c0_g1_i1:37-351(-)
MCGKGSIEFTNGDSYRGQFKDNKFNGNGVYTHPNGVSMSGKWVNSIKEGKFVFQKDKEILTGTVKNENTIFQSNTLNGFGLSVMPSYPIFEMDQSVQEELRLLQ